MAKEKISKEEQAAINENKQLQKQWRDFEKTLAFQRLMEHIEMQKEVYNILASGPMEVYKDVPTFGDKTIQQLDFEPEKYAYLLQRGVGCDIVKLYVEEFTTPKQVQQ